MIWGLAGSTLCNIDEITAGPALAIWLSQRCIRCESTAPKHRRSQNCPACDLSIFHNLYPGNECQNNGIKNSRWLKNWKIVRRGKQAPVRFFRKEEPVAKYKKGAVILVGGGDGHIDTAYGTACTLLHHINCYHIHEAVYSHNTNERPAIDDENVLVGVNSILEFFSEEE